MHVPDLNPGEIIAIEEPFFVELAPDVLHLRCAYCAKSKKMSLIVHESFPMSKSTKFEDSSCFKE